MKKIAIAFLLLVMVLSLGACSLFGISNPSNKPSDKTPDTSDSNNPSEKPSDDPSDDPNTQEVVITFDVNGGAFADGKTTVEVTPDENGNVVLNDEPRRDGHAFVGWYNGETKFDPSAKYTSTQTFTAKYVSGGENKVYDALFKETATVTIDMNMSDAEWKKLNQDYIDFRNKGSKSPIYRMANSVTISIDDGNGLLNYYYEEVGVRMKGNTSRHEFYGDNGFFENVHYKLSFKQTFDDPDDGYKQNELKVWTDDTKRAERKARTLGGMEKIDIKYNSTVDETYVREAYAMKLFRDNGIYAPHVTLCSLTALEKDTDKKNLGVYRIHECIDEVFITRNIGESKVGDLYKCTYNSVGPANLTMCNFEEYIGVEDELKGEFFPYDKKTNKKKDKTTGKRDFSSMINFITVINGDNPNFEQLIDVDYFTKFEAINYILGNPDCIRNNYNNYYLYFRADGKAIIIPYDYDRCLGLTEQWDPTSERDPNSPALINVTPFTRTVAATGNQQSNPLYVKLIDKGAPYGEGSALMRYRQNLINLSTSQAFTAAAFNAYKDSYKLRYAQYTATAINTNALAFDSNNTSNVPYATYIAKKLQTLNNNINNYCA